jgi:site-specific DNA recombinase
MRLSQGNLMGSGNQLYGYKYIRKTPNSPARYEINEYEADVVKFVFEKYANEYIGTAKLSRTLEEMGKLNKGGKVLWRTSLIKCMLKNEAYTGIRYYNMYKWSFKKD